MEEKKGSLTGRLKAWLPTFPQMIAFPFIQTAVYELTNRLSIYGIWFPVCCELDRRLPLVGWFVIPYLLWFPYMFGTVAFLLFTDRYELKRLLKYFIFAAFCAYPLIILYPTMMPLRPDSVSGTGLIPWLLNLVYFMDNNRTVFPSFHVIFAAGPVFALGRTRHFSSLPAKASLILLSLLISVSTFMIKQHSALDMIGAVPFILIGWYLTYSGAEKEPAEG